MADNIINQSINKFSKNERMVLISRRCCLFMKNVNVVMKGVFSRCVQKIQREDVCQVH